MKFLIVTRIHIQQRFSKGCPKNVQRDVPRRTVSCVNVLKETYLTSKRTHIESYLVSIYIPNLATRVPFDYDVGSKSTAR